MEHENGWKRLDEHLLARLAEARLDRAEQVAGARCVRVRLLCVYRIVLLSVSMSVIRTYVWVEWEEGKRTWMSSWSDRQSSMVTVSGWFGARTVERNFPPNMRIRGDSTDSAYS
jgi:hypothetical protein